MHRSDGRQFCDVLCTYKNEDRHERSFGDSWGVSLQDVETDTRTVVRFEELENVCPMESKSSRRR